ARCCGAVKAHRHKGFAGGTGRALPAPRSLLHRRTRRRLKTRPTGHRPFKEDPEMGALKLIADAFHEGGWPMWPILLLLVVSWGIFIERCVYLAKAGIDKEKLLALLKSQIMQ